MNHHLVRIIKCPAYQPSAVRSAMREAVEALGGLPVRPGDRVLLKPNLLTTKSPERAVTTHPEIVAAAAELVMDCGGKPFIGDSPSGSPGAGIFRATGMKEIADKLAMETINFSHSEMTDGEARGNVYFFARPAVECEVIINLPKLKTHSLTMFTGAVKNMYGCLPGFQKGNWHRRAPKNDQFSQVVVDVFSCFQPRINIMDGILAMEGEGPSNGNPRQLGILIASDNAPALDRIAGEIIGFQQDEILTTRYAELRGLTLPRRDIQLSGASIEEVKPAGFALPKDRYMRMIPELAHDILGRFIWTRPQVNKMICSQCGKCVANCPVQAMSMNGAPPAINYDLCIKCYCCDEVCPDGAIGKQMSWLAKKLS